MVSACGGWDLGMGWGGMEGWEDGRKGGGMRTCAVPFKTTSSPPGVMGPMYWSGTKTALASVAGVLVASAEMGPGAEPATGVVRPWGNGRVSVDVFEGKRRDAEID